MRPLKVDALRVGLNDVGGHIARDLKHTLVVLDGVLEVDGSFGKILGVGVVLFFQIYDSLHQRMIEIESNLRMIGIIICHFVFVVCKVLGNRMSESGKSHFRSLHSPTAPVFIYCSFYNI